MSNPTGSQNQEPEDRKSRGVVHVGHLGAVGVAALFALLVWGSLASGLTTWVYAHYDTCRMVDLYVGGAIVLAYRFNKSRIETLQTPKPWIVVAFAAVVVMMMGDMALGVSLMWAPQLEIEGPTHHGNDVFWYAATDLIALGVGITQIIGHQGMQRPVSVLGRWRGRRR
ncbi:hypothetical protein SAMN05216466_106126 [Paraburkholderia phenazinium]|uniref:Uncharacterized protein n=1 Tax=Paraburkholderia phenazinium TaxID=60549 RepID=A0A1G7YCJ5_9BURK|nr:hypothetical protein [Paraburkholderia phenazinium]SDG94046.1 hypothetical protein SAMN05216466_106126 [Paraburkholderia phenazinium]